jgi:hypothetical protein
MSFNQKSRAISQSDVTGRKSRRGDERKDAARYFAPAEFEVMRQNIPFFSTSRTILPSKCSSIQFFINGETS